MRPCHFFQRREGVLGIGHLVVFLFHQYITCCNKSWPEIFLTLWMKGKLLHRDRAHLKVPGWSLVWNELLTKKLPMFSSRLNEITGDYEKIAPVSESFWSNLNFKLRMIDLTAWLWGWNVRVNGMRLVFSFSAACSADCRSIRWAWW